MKFCVTPKKAHAARKRGMTIVSKPSEEMLSTSHVDIYDEPHELIATQLTLLEWGIEASCV